MGMMVNLIRQHLEISDIVETLEDFMKKDNLEEDASEIAKNISILAGKLKIHLDTEDRLLYPRLLNGSNNDLKTVAIDYEKEMGHISGAFMKFKDKFNTKNKLLSDLDGFSKELKIILNTLMNRISKEDKDLYPLIED